MNEYKDYYEILGVAFGASDDEIRKAYREGAKKYHTDSYTGGAEDVKELLNSKFLLVEEAYNVLRDSNTRASYDLEYVIWMENKDDIERENRKKEKSEASKANEESKNSAFSQVKKDIFKILEEEKAMGSFSERHAKLDTKIFNLFDDKGKLFPLLRGSLHLSHEVMMQMERFSKITTDTIPQYAFRNRRFIEGVVAIMIMSNLLGEPKSDTPVIDSDVTTETAYEEITTTVRLNRVYQVKAGDTLSDIALDNGVSISDLRRHNDIENENIIQPGTSLVIPYFISSDDLEYMTSSCEFSKGGSLKDFATAHETDIETLIQLNPEAIIENDNHYFVLSDSIVVPEFMTREELKAEKEQVQTEQKVYKN